MLDILQETCESLSNFQQLFPESSSKITNKISNKDFMGLAFATKLAVDFVWRNPTGYSRGLLLNSFSLNLDVLVPDKFSKQNNGNNRPLRLKHLKDKLFDLS